MPATARVAEAEVVEVTADGQVIAESAGARHACRVPQHIDMGWLRAALKIAPVDAQIALPDDDGNGGAAPTLWCLFPSQAHAQVAAETIELSASKAINLVCGKASVHLKKDGAVRLRGRDVYARGSRAARLKGGTIRLN
jgi:hypothetical protein